MATEAILTVSIPDVITFAMWECYNDAQQKYIAKQKDAGKSASLLMCNYIGAVALIDAGFVHISGLDEAIRLLKSGTQDTSPMPLITFIARQVADVVEAKINAPLETIFSKVSADTSSGQSSDQKTSQQPHVRQRSPSAAI